MIFSRLDLTNARIIVTGASSGIGWALALRLWEQRARIVLASRNADRLGELSSLIRQKGGEAIPVATDVADAEERARLIRKTVEMFGGIDILINNAGVVAMGNFAEASEERLRRIFEVNFFGSTELTRLALPYLRHAKNPMIVNIASVLGRRAIPGCTEYCASKFALIGWAEGMRAELAGEGIHVLVVCPGAIESGFHDNLLEDRLPKSPLRGHRSMSADCCARIIVRAMRKKQNEIVITAGGKALVWGNRHFPRFFDFVMARMARRG